MRSLLREWAEYKAERGQRYKPKGLNAVAARLVEWGPERSRIAVAFSMSNGYTGLFEPRSTPQTSGTHPLAGFKFKPPSERTA